VGPLERGGHAKASAAGKVMASSKVVRIERSSSHEEVFAILGGNGEGLRVLRRLVL